MRKGETYHSPGVSLGKGPAHTTPTECLLPLWCCMLCTFVPSLTLCLLGSATWQGFAEDEISDIPVLRNQRIEIGYCPGLAQPQKEPGGERMPSHLKHWGLQIDLWPVSAGSACLEEPLPFLKSPVCLVMYTPSLVSQEAVWEGDLKPVWSFCKNFFSTRQVLNGGCRLGFTSASVLFIFASLQYYQLLLHMGDPYCASVKWYHIMLLCLYHQTLLMKKSPGLPRFICSIYFSQTLFWIKHLR